MGTHRLATPKHNNMKVLILASALVACAYAEADADALYYGAYGAYGGAALGYPYAYARGYAAGYAAPVVAAAPAVAAVRTVAAAPVVAAAPAVAAVRTVAAPVIAKSAPLVAAAPVVAKAAPVIAAAPVVAKAAPVVAEVRAAVPTVTSSQFHSQDEDKNYSFGYSNINSARQESGNALTGVVGSYSDGFRTYNYVADGLGFRHI